MREFSGVAVLLISSVVFAQAEPLNTSGGGVSLSGTNTWTGSQTFNLGLVLPGVATGSLPTCDASHTGIQYDTTTSSLKICNGTAWSATPTLGSANTWTATQTFSGTIGLGGGTGTRIQSDGNTISVIGNTLAISTSNSTGVNVQNTNGILFTPTSSVPTCNSGAKSQTYFNSTNNQLRVCDGTNWEPVTSPFTVFDVESISAVTSTAATNLAKWIQPGAIKVTGGSIWITSAGTVGTTNAVFRVSDGTNNCDVSFACNTAASLVNLNSTSGTCTFAANASLTMSINSIGNCTVGPQFQTFTIYGVNN